MVARSSNCCSTVRWVKIILELLGFIRPGAPHRVGCLIDRSFSFHDPTAITVPHIPLLSAPPTPTLAPPPPPLALHRFHCPLLLLPPGRAAAPRPPSFLLLMTPRRRCLPAPSFLPLASCPRSLLSSFCSWLPSGSPAMALTGAKKNAMDATRSPSPRGPSPTTRGSFARRSEASTAMNPPGGGASTVSPRCSGAEAETILPGGGSSTASPRVLGGHIDEFAWWTCMHAIAAPLTGHRNHSSR